MKFTLAIAVVASALSVGARAHAAGPGVLLGDCSVEPEAPRTPVVAIVAADDRARVRLAQPRPFSAVPRACTSPDDPGCRAAVPPPSHEGIQIEHASHGIVQPPNAQHAAPASAIEFVQDVTQDAGPHDAHADRLYRPPLA